MSKRALFLDRDGVLIPDAHLLKSPDQVSLEPGAAEAVSAAQRAGLLVIVVSNQTVVSRGLCSEQDVVQVNAKMSALLRARGCEELDGVYFCPHHPDADVLRYRIDCECRKPKPGMLLRAAKEHAIDLAHSVMVGDRISDVLAGSRAGCKTVLVTTGQHDQKPIVGVRADDHVTPDYTFADLRSAMPSILQEAKR